MTAKRFHSASWPSWSRISPSAESNIWIQWKKLSEKALCTKHLDFNMQSVYIILVSNINVEKLNSLQRFQGWHQQRCSTKTADDVTVSAMSATAFLRLYKQIWRSLWLQRGRRTVCHHRPGPPPRYWHFSGRPSLIFSVSHLADESLALSLLIDS